MEPLAQSISNVLSAHLSSAHLRVTVYLIIGIVLLAGAIFAVLRYKALRWVRQVALLGGLAGAFSLAFAGITFMQLGELKTRIAAAPEASKTVIAAFREQGVVVSGLWADPATDLIHVSVSKPGYFLGRHALITEPPEIIIVPRSALVDALAAIGIQQIKPIAPINTPALPAATPSNGQAPVAAAPAPTTPPPAP